MASNNAIAAGASQGVAVSSSGVGGKVRRVDPDAQTPTLTPALALALALDRL